LELLSSTTLSRTSFDPWLRVLEHVAVLIVVVIIVVIIIVVASSSLACFSHDGVELDEKLRN
jgi:ABC-type phosphate transport system permease subunit